MAPRWLHLDQAFVPDLHPQGVEEDDRIAGVERSGLPFPDLLKHGVGDPADQVGGNFGPVDLLQVALYLPDRQAAGVEADDLRIEAVQPRRDRPKSLSDLGLTMKSTRPVNRKSDPLAGRSKPTASAAGCIS